MMHTWASLRVLNAPPAWLCCCRGPFEAGKPLSGGGIGLVKASKSSRFKEGDVVTGMVPWSTYFVADTAGQVRHNVCSTGCLRTLGVEEYLCHLGKPVALWCLWDGN